MLRKLLLILAALGSCCQPARSIPPQSDAGIVLDASQGSDDCGRAGDRLQALGCRGKSGAPLWVTPGGMTFAAACRAAAGDPAPRDWHAGCLAHLPSCDLADSVFRGEVCP